MPDLPASTSLCSDRFMTGAYGRGVQQRQSSRSVQKRLRLWRECDEGSEGRDCLSVWYPGHMARDGSVAYAAVAIVPFAAASPATNRVWHTGFRNTVTCGYRDASSGGNPRPV